MNNTSLDIAHLHPICTCAEIIVDMLTKDQLKTLKGRLQFDPRKLPLTTQSLRATLLKDESIYNLLHHRYVQLLDDFQSLVLPAQLEVLQSYVEKLEQQLEQCEDDDELEYLDLLHGHLLNFLEELND